MGYGDKNVEQASAWRSFDGVYGKQKSITHGMSSWHARYKLPFDRAQGGQDTDKLQISNYNIQFKIYEFKVNVQIINECKLKLINENYTHCHPESPCEGSTNW